MIEGNWYTGGIMGVGRDDIMIVNCTNYGNITNFNNGTDKHCGGIVGSIVTATIINCSNERNTILTGGDYTGGIVGRQCLARGYAKIFNCYNLGKIIGNKYSGGIIGDIYSLIFSKNTYSIGDVTGITVGGIAGSALWNNSSNEFVNCYYQNSSTVTKAAGTNIPNTVATGVNEISEEIINVFNDYIDSAEETETSEWKHWKMKENEYPSFQ